jgi:hypothetical protein
MGVIDDLADALAKDTLAAAERTGNEQLIVEVGRQLGASSSTMEEAYQTYIRVRQAEARARQYLNKHADPSK